MKRIQILKAAFVVLAIGGAVASKAGSNVLATKYTVNGVGTPCTSVVSGCLRSGTVVCTQFTVNNVDNKTFYDATCAVVLYKS